MSHELLTSIVGIAAIGSSVFCIHSGILYSRARKRMELMTREYMSVVNSTVQQATSESLADHVQLCGGCGGHFPQSQIEVCGVKKWGDRCPNYQMMLAERDAT